MWRSYNHALGEKKTIILSDHNSKQEDFVQFLVNNIHNHHDDCFVISDKRYMYDNIRWYTPYEKIVDFEFGWKDMDKLLDVLEEKSGRLVIIADIGMRVGSKCKEIWEKLEPLLKKKFTLIVACSNNNWYAPINEFDNIILDVSTFMTEKLYEKVKSNLTISYSTFRKMLCCDLDPDAFYIIYDGILLPVVMKECDKIKKKYTIKKMVPDKMYRKIRDLNKQPSDEQRKQWDKVPRPKINLSSDDWMMQGFRFS